jgi:hypothetical protein
MNGPGSFPQSIDFRSRTLRPMMPGGPEWPAAFVFEWWGRRFSRTLRKPPSMSRRQPGSPTDEGEGMRTAIIFMTMLLGTLPTVLAQSVSLEASRDATLIEHPEGALANGAGPALFIGRTAQGENSLRRTLIAFDVAAALPRSAIVQGVSLTLSMTASNPDPRVIRLHRVLADWGEGPSSSSGGGGAPSQTGDATWIHTFWDTDFWVRSGGQFLGRVSAERVVGATAVYTWNSTDHLVQDVRLWNVSPELNFGWILIGDEQTAQSVKSFASRENPDLSLRPVLEISYRMPGEPPLD